MLSNNTFLETSIQQLLDGLSSVEKGLREQCSACSKRVGVYTLAEIVSKMFGKSRGEIVSVLKKIISDNASLTFQEVGGVTHLLIFCLMVSR